MAAKTPNFIAAYSIPQHYIPIKQARQHRITVITEGDTAGRHLQLMFGQCLASLQIPYNQQPIRRDGRPAPAAAGHSHD